MGRALLILTIATALLGGFVRATAQTATPAKDETPAKAPGVGAEPDQLKVPVGFKAAEGAKAEPYTKTGWAQEIIHEQTGMALAYVPAGEFLMGSPANEANRDNDEVQHRVTLTKGYYLGKYEVTQGQWEMVMGNNPSGFKGRDNPVEQVSWYDCQGFIKKLNAALPPPITDRRSPVTPAFRLPTEAEWEYACRAGTKTVFHYGDSLEASQANFDGNYPYGNGRKGEYRQKTVPVGSFKPNAWGLYDMHGNVWEWCRDCYGDYATGAQTDPTGPEDGLFHVGRGGSWIITALICRSANRIRDEPGYRDDRLGCRLAFSPAPVAAAQTAPDKEAPAAKPPAQGVEPGKGLPGAKTPKTAAELDAEQAKPPPAPAAVRQEAPAAKPPPAPPTADPGS